MFRLKADFSAMFQRLRWYTANVDERLRRIADTTASLLLKDSAQAFQRQRDPVTGEAWQSSKRAKKQHGQTLLDTGMLRRSLQAIQERKPRGRVAVLGGSSVVYAAVHQFGWPERNIPQRRYMGLTQKSEDKITALVRRLLDAGT